MQCGLDSPLHTQSPLPPASSVPISRSAGLGLKERREASERLREAEDLEGLSNGDWEQVSDQVGGAEEQPVKKGGGTVVSRTESTQNEREGKVGDELQAGGEGGGFEREGGEGRNATRGGHVAVVEDEELGIDDEDEAERGWRAAGAASNTTRGDDAKPTEKKGRRAPSLLVSEPGGEAT